MNGFEKVTAVIRTDQNKHLIFPYLKSMGGVDRHGIENIMDHPMHKDRVKKYYIGGVFGDTILPMYHELDEELQDIVEIPSDFKI